MRRAGGEELDGGAEGERDRRHHLGPAQEAGPGGVRVAEEDLVADDERLTGDETGLAQNEEQLRRAVLTLWQTNLLRRYKQGGVVFHLACQIMDGMCLAGARRTVK